MQRLHFRAPGRDTELPELLAALGVRDHSGVEIVSVSGRPFEPTARSVPAGARVVLDAKAPAPEPMERSRAFDVLVAQPPWETGSLRPRGAALAYRVVARRGDVAALCIEAEAESPASEVLDALAAAGLPVLGDCRRGGVLVPGGVRIRRAERADEAWWPDVPLHVEAASLRVSRATVRVLRRGHPWILPDEESDDASAWRPGARVGVVGPGGEKLGTALVDGDERIAARLWARGAALGGGDDPSIEERVARALERRASLGARGALRPLRAGRTYTDACRLIHGEADGLPGIAVDQLGGLLRMVVSSPGAALGVVPRVAEALLAGERAGSPIVEVLNLRRAAGARHESVRWLAGAEQGGALLDARGRLAVHERGLRFLVDPGLRDPTQPRPGHGLYLDQRENRERLAAVTRRRGGRWLNLFAHTGAFSVALLEAGAEQVVSVDLSAPYLAWLEENVALNAEAGVDAARHRSVRRDGRRYLGELGRGERFTGIVLDPPTAAAAGRRFFSTRRDLAPLIGDALARLEPGGVLLVSRNHRRARGELRDLVADVARERRIGVERIERADPGPDFPRLAGFPEGDSFRGVLAIRR